MRLPVTPQLSTKDGTSNKNARLTNTLKETAAQGEFAVSRPGLNQLTSTTGNGKGLVNFNDELVSVYGASLGFEKISQQLEFMEIVYTDPVTYPYVFAMDYEQGNYIMSGSASPGGVPFVAKSADFLTWSIHFTSGWGSTIYGDNTPKSLSIAILNGTFYMLANIGSSDTHIFSSTDGLTWTQGALIVNGYVQDNWGSLFRLGDKLYVKRGSTTYVSSDAVNWSVSAIPPYITNAASYGGVYIATDSSSLFYSFDNTTWATATLPDLDGDTVQMVGGGARGFFAATYYTGSVLISTDGVNWALLGKQPVTTGYVDFGGFSANNHEVCLVYYDDYYANYAIYNIGYGVWKYIRGVNPQRVDYWLMSSDKGFISPHNLVVSQGVDADNGFILTNTNAVKPLQDLSGDFFDFAQSTL